MLPRSVTCGECGQTVPVRGIGRIEYAWPESITPDLESITPKILSARLTIDCPSCGVRLQDFFPAGAPRRKAMPGSLALTVTRRLETRGQPVDHHHPQSLR